MLQLASCKHFTSSKGFFQSSMDAKKVNFSRKFQISNFQTPAQNLQNLNLIEILTEFPPKLLGR